MWWPCQGSTTTKGGVVGIVRTLVLQLLIASTTSTTVSSISSSATTTTFPVWVRGVNLGGWLLLERYITPFLFAITECHLEGELCWYPEQLADITNNASNSSSSSSSSSSSDDEDEDEDDDDDDFPVCDIATCPVVRHRRRVEHGRLDAPVDEYTLWQTFHKHGQTAAAERWLNVHLETFVSYRDLQAVAAAGVTHVRVPLPHWILGLDDQDQRERQPWIVGRRWQALQQLVDWARSLGLQVWPDLHTAPGSQNNFDNSGRWGVGGPTGGGWCYNVQNVMRTLEYLHQITAQIVVDEMDDVITGFGILNEPFLDCPFKPYKDFLEAGFAIVRHNLGPAASVYASDLFGPSQFNDGSWWLDDAKYHDTYLDSHFYQVFDEYQRALSPRQHIALACQNQYHRPEPQDYPNYNPGGINSCCFQDGPFNNTMPSKGGVHRMVGEWSAATDRLPVEATYKMMTTIAETGRAWQADRQLSPERQAYLRNYVLAQMISYEAQETLVYGTAWFYWTMRMQDGGGAFAEWDFLRGVREGWIPTPLPPSHISTQDWWHVASCYDLILQTSDNAKAIISEYPPDNPTLWRYEPPSDDVVVTHGESVRSQTLEKEQIVDTDHDNVTVADDEFAGEEEDDDDFDVKDLFFDDAVIEEEEEEEAEREKTMRLRWISIVAVVFCMGLAAVGCGSPSRGDYTPIASDE